MVSSDHDEIRDRHVAVLAFPFGTHAAPLYALVRSLAVAAPAVAFSFFSSAKSNALLGRIARSAPSNLRLYDVPDGCPEGFVLDPRNPEEEIELFMGVTPGNFRKGVEVAVRDTGGVRVCCVVSDCFLWFAGEMACEMGGVPWVPLWTGGPRSLSVHLYTDVLRRTIGVGDLDEDLGFLPGLSSLRVRDLPEGVVFGDLNSVFARLLHRMGQELPRAAAVAINTFEELDPAVLADLSTKFKKCLPVGPLNLLVPLPVEPADDASGCLSWLDRQAPGTVAYVGFGTVMSPPPDELAELAGGLEASGVPFLWSLKEKLLVHLPAGFLDRTSGRGLVVPWAPQPRVLEHAAVGAFVTHCGWNSVTESMTAGGVPMICRPFFGDQRLNARSISHVWEIGVGIEGGILTKDRVAKALNLVMKTDEGKGMKERACGLKELAVGSVGQGGSSMENLNSLLKIVSGTNC